MLRKKVPAWTVLIAGFGAIAAVSLAGAIARTSSEPVAERGASPAHTRATIKKVGEYKYVYGKASTGDAVGQTNVVMRCPAGTQLVGGGGGGFAEAAGQHSTNFSGPGDSADAGTVPEDAWTVYVDQLVVPADPAQRVASAIAICRIKGGTSGDLTGGGNNGGDGG